MINEMVLHLLGIAREAKGLELRLYRVVTESRKDERLLCLFHDLNLVAEGRMPNEYTTLLSRTGVEILKKGFLAKPNKYMSLSRDTLIVDLALGFYLIATQPHESVYRDLAGEYAVALKEVHDEAEEQAAIENEREAHGGRPLLGGVD